MSFHASPSDRTVRCCTFSKILPSSCFASGFLHRPHCRIALEQLTAQVDAGLVLKTSGVPHFLSDFLCRGRRVSRRRQCGHQTQRWGPFTQEPATQFLLVVGYTWTLKGNHCIKVPLVSIAPRGSMFQGAFMVIGVLVQRDLRTGKLFAN